MRNAWDGDGGASLGIANPWRAFLSWDVLAKTAQVEGERHEGYAYIPTECPRGREHACFVVVFGKQVRSEAESMVLNCWNRAIQTRRKLHVGSGEARGV
jgi:hypothetical protein